MSEIIWYVSFSDWLISLSIILSRSIYAVVANGKASSFLWLNNIPVCVCTKLLSIHLLMDAWAASIILAFENNTVINTRVHISFELVFLYSLGKHSVV